MDQLVIVGLEWVGTLALFLAFIVFMRYLDHKERMSMIERGLVPSQHTLLRRYTRGSAVLRGGLITAAVGVAVTFALYTLGYLLPPPFSAAPGRIGPWLLPGLIPMAVGAALIASYYLIPPRAENGERSAEDDEGAAPKERGESARRPGWRVLDAPSPHDPRDDHAAQG
jgi:hypothetical protein